jgi:CRISPR/Cas system-associated exonuclease Cas4 (RecB family)
VFDVALWPICSPHYDKLKKSDEAYALEATLREIYLKSVLSSSLSSFLIFR